MDKSISNDYNGIKIINIIFLLEDKQRVTNNDCLVFELNSHFLFKVRLAEYLTVENNQFMQYNIPMWG